MNRVDICEETFEKLFKSKPNDGEGHDFELMQILQRFIFGEVSQIGTIDDKLRELITITILGLYQTFPQLKAHCSAALNIGVTPFELRETLYLLMPFIGCPKTLNAINCFNEICQEKGISLPLSTGSTIEEDTRFQEGLNIQNELYGSEIKDKYQDLPEAFAKKIPEFLTTWCFGDFYTRKGLDIKIKELLVLVILTALGTTEPVAAHVNANLKLGNTKEMILSVLIQALPYTGFPLFFKSLNVVKEVLFTDKDH